jgi:MGT family glycosyltransferase
MKSFGEEMTDTPTLPIRTPGQFLFAMFQGSGNIPPILAVARGLVARGHCVRIVAGPGLQPDRAPRPVSAAFLQGIMTAGATLVPFQETHDPFLSAPPPRGFFRGWTPKMFAVNVFEARRILASPLWAQNIAEELRRQPVDVVVTDYFLLGALAAAEAAGVRAVALVHTVYSRPTPGLPPYGPGFLPSRGPVAWWRDAIGRAVIRSVHRREALPALNQARAQLGLRPLRSPFAQYDTAARVLIMTSSAFDFRPHSLPPNVRYVGMPFEDVDGATWHSPWPSDDKRPLVLVSFSTALQGQTDVLRITLEALAPLSIRGLVTLGPALAKDEFQAPANVVLIPFVPHALILPQVAAVVSQCGHGTVLKALAHGVPLVCLPLGGDQPDVAARVVHAGAGVRLPRNASSMQIRTALQRILTEPSFREAARRMAAILATEDGVRTAVDELKIVATRANR